MQKVLYTNQIADYFPHRHFAFSPFFTQMVINNAVMTVSQTKNIATAEAVFVPLSSASVRNGIDESNSNMYTIKHTHPSHVTGYQP